MDTILLVKTGKLDVEDIPIITVYKDEGNFLYSLNNRRLYVFKELKKQGFTLT
jgi:hypothetical protein